MKLVINESENEVFKVKGFDFNKWYATISEVRQLPIGVANKPLQREFQEFEVCDYCGAEKPRNRSGCCGEVHFSTHWYEVNAKGQIIDDTQYTDKQLMEMGY